MQQIASQGLEGSCAAASGGRAGDWIRLAPAPQGRPGGMERMEAAFAGHAFAPHRHDSYALGYTLQGVQSFRYKGAARNSLAGQVFVLHPDEVHDGHAGTEDGFRYRIVYVAPRLIQDALGGSRPLPFVRGAVSLDARLTAAIGAALDDLESPVEELQRDQMLLDLAEALAANDASASARPIAQRHQRAVRAARELLDEAGAAPVTSAELEAATGLSRYELARQFREALGTSPYRYLTQRRLDRARAMIREGLPLAEVAAACGFADQSHMSRQFKQSYGISPGRWIARLAAGREAA